MTLKSYTAVLADDHGIVRTGLRAALEGLGADGQTQIKILGEAENGLQTVELVKRLAPDLVMLDITMPLASGAEIFADLRRWSPETKIVVLTAVTSPGLLAQMVSGGADGIFPKGADAAAMLEALPLILRGSRVIDPAITAIMRDTPPGGALTARELQTLNMVLAGKTNAEMAGLMGISARTAEKHRASMMAKLGVKNLAELMAKALQDGLIAQHGVG